jgi:anti-sigma B factor antagonist
MAVTDSTLAAVANGTATVLVQGEIDIATAPDLRRALAEAMVASPNQLVVDLAATTFLDCSGIAAIVDAHRRAPASCQIVLRSPAPIIRKVIELIGIDQICLIEP